MLDADVARLRSLVGRKWTRYGSDVLPAWVADMDFDPPQPVKKAMIDLIDRGDLGYYFDGIHALGSTWSNWLQRRHGWSPSPEECWVFTGALHAMESILSMCTEPGDGVVLFTPIYAPFRAAIEQFGRRVVDVPLDAPTWRLDADHLRSAIDESTTMVLFCQPHNPLGRVFDADELHAFTDVVVEHDLLVISDEIWGDLVRSDIDHLPLAQADPRLADRLVTVSSASKTFSLAGLRCAVAHVGSPSVRAALDALPPHMPAGPSSLSAAATLAAWTECDAWYDDVVRQLDANAAHLQARVADLPGLSMHRPEATYLAWLDFSNTAVADNPSKQLLKRANLALEPGEKFGTQATAFARLNFATSSKLLDAALDAIATVLR